MPIAASLPLLKTQLANVMKLKQVGTPDTIATILTSAISASAATGLLTGVPPVPTVPVGAPLSQLLFRAGFNYGNAAQSDLAATKVADGVKAIVPIVPPTGYTLLLQQLKRAFNLKQAGNPEAFGIMASSAIITYFTSGLVI